MTTTQRIFLASSNELADERRAFEIDISRKNSAWVPRGVFLELKLWESFFDAISKTRSQDEYNCAIVGCDVFVLLVHTKLGKYSKEEFETALARFHATGKPVMYVYLQQADGAAAGPAGAPLTAEQARDAQSLAEFKDRLREMGHFPNTFKTTDGLLLHFSQQLDMLADRGFIETRPDVLQAVLQAQAAAAAAGPQVQASGHSVVAVGPGAGAVGPGGLIVQGSVNGPISMGQQTTVHTGGGAHIAGAVNTGGGDFIGRDKTTTTPGTSPGPRGRGGKR